MQPPSPETTQSTGGSVSSLRSAMAAETAVILTEKRPPKPQHSSSASQGTSSAPAPSKRVAGSVSRRSSRSAWHPWCAAIRRPARPSPSRVTPSRRTMNSPSSQVRFASRASPPRMPGWNFFTMVAHDPLGTTTASESAKTSTVWRDMRRASAARPALWAGWPQQVCASGKVTVQPRWRRRRTASAAASAK